MITKIHYQSRTTTPSSKRKPKSQAKLQRSCFFKASVCRQYPYIDTSSLQSRQFPPLPNDAHKIVEFAAMYLNRAAMICFYNILSALFTKEIRALSREGIQAVMRETLRKYYKEEQVFDVGDISKITNLLDALGLLAKKYCCIGDDRYANRYMANPVLRDNKLRLKVLGLIKLSFEGKTVVKIRQRINNRWTKTGGYFKTIMSLWRGVPDSFLGLNPTHEQEDSLLNKFKNKKVEVSPKKGLSIEASLEKNHKGEMLSALFPFDTMRHLKSALRHETDAYALHKLPHYFSAEIKTAQIMKEALLQEIMNNAEEYEEVYS